MTLSEIQTRNYAATVRRGLITEKTVDLEFIIKIFEEASELAKAKNDDDIRDELADVIITCLSFAHHFDIDVEFGLECKTLFNEMRP
jgi:NTP pyrophosphatase (non-canonical NTP hydrolase)